MRIDFWSIADDNTDRHEFAVRGEPAEVSTCAAPRGRGASDWFTTPNGAPPDQRPRNCSLVTGPVLARLATVLMLTQNDDGEVEEAS